jgi:hypothetical protein
VDCGKDWTLEQIKAAITQGPYQLAMMPESLKLIQEDTTYQVRACYAEVVEWTWLKENLPAQLKISPLTVVPQANQFDHMILDLSFLVLQQEKHKHGKKQKRVCRAYDILLASTNDTTAKLVPEVPVKELGNVFSHLL